MSWAKILGFSITAGKAGYRGYKWAKPRYRKARRVYRKGRRTGSKIWSALKA